MNVYAIYPHWIKEENYPYLLNILKVQRIISLAQRHPSICESFLIYKASKHDNNYEYDESFVKNMIQQAVYTFIKPMCQPKIQNNKWEGEFIINNLYQKSRANNPIYNLEYCNDANVLVLVDEFYYYKDFINYSLNILNKNAKEYHYEERICFVNFLGKTIEFESVLHDFFHRTAIFYQRKFEYLLRFIPSSKHSESEKKEKHSFSVGKLGNYQLQELKDKGTIYDPLLSYLNIKSKEYYPEKKGNTDFFDFFLGREHLNSILNYYLDALKEEKHYSHELYQYKNEVEAWGADSEMDYIRNNGGEWIDD